MFGRLDQRARLFEPLSIAFHGEFAFDNWPSQERFKNSPSVKSYTAFL